MTRSQFETWPLFASWSNLFPATKWGQLLFSSGFYSRKHSTWIRTCMGANFSLLIVFITTHKSDAKMQIEWHSRVCYMPFDLYTFHCLFHFSTCTFTLLFTLTVCAATELELLELKPYVRAWRHVQAFESCSEYWILLCLGQSTIGHTCICRRHACVNRILVIVFW